MVEKLAVLLQDCKNAVFFGGAGVSTESGLKDFRSEDGLYQAMKEFDRSPEQLLSHSFFAAHPQTFFEYYKSNLINTQAKPNDAHFALARLEQQGRLKAVVTQNIDGLHQQAGSKTVYELHGSVYRNFCAACNIDYTLDYVLHPQKEREGVPLCTECGGMVRPDVVLYEEQLDDGVLQSAILAISQADVLIVGGTSLVVYPAAGLLEYFNGSALVLINKSRTPFDSKATLVINDSVGKVLKQAVDSLNQ
ncbi:NAD-dependent protein deacylase [Christensenellaceae bacterium OttesenSCG-928-K19]|nr:NAD-dependent protein deacylase [Christensenellaceae bacterium OttesenSCG-928-K19]